VLRFLRFEAGATARFTHVVAQVHRSSSASERFALAPMLDALVDVRDLVDDVERGGTTVPPLGAAHRDAVRWVVTGARELAQQRLLQVDDGDVTLVEAVLELVNAIASAAGARARVPTAGKARQLGFAAVPVLTLFDGELGEQPEDEQDAYDPVTPPDRCPSCLHGTSLHDGAGCLALLHAATAGRLRCSCSLAPSAIVAADR
jgi:hypothetical protein